MYNSTYGDIIRNIAPLYSIYNNPFCTVGQQQTDKGGHLFILITCACTVHVTTIMKTHQELTRGHCKYRSVKVTYRHPLLFGVTMKIG